MIDIKAIAEKLLSELVDEAKFNAGEQAGVIKLYERIKDAAEHNKLSGTPKAGTEQDPPGNQAGRD